MIGLNISASSLTFKFWGTENFVALAKHIKARLPDAILLILYAKDYASFAKEIAQQSGAVLSEATPTLSDFAALISMLDALITPDSAAVHFADIFRVPSLILTHFARRRNRMVSLFHSVQGFARTRWSSRFNSLARRACCQR